MGVNAIVVDNFYDDPDAVVAYAMKQEFYKPYTVCSKPELVPAWAHEWLTTKYKSAKDCPFKSSKALISRIQEIIGEEIDMNYWNAVFPMDKWDFAPLYANQKEFTSKWTAENLQISASWNGSIHRKFRKNEKGTFVHTHSIDPLNGTGPMGWAGVVYLSPQAPLDSGLTVWQNKEGQTLMNDHGAPNPDRWEQIDEYANIYNRLIIHRGNVPHSGGAGWDGPPERARCFQTFFFKTKVNERGRLKMSNLK